MPPMCSFATDGHTRTWKARCERTENSLLFAIHKTAIVLGRAVYSGNSSDSRDQIASVSYK